MPGGGHGSSPATGPGTHAGNNPFRSAAVDGLDYLPLEPGGWEAIRTRLATTGYRGAIVGPRGHGKSTLLRCLPEHIELPVITRKRGASAGVGSPGSEWSRVVWVTARPGHRPTPSGWQVAFADRTRPLLVDGYDWLDPWARWRVARRDGVTLVTSHRRTALPTVLRCETTPRLLIALAHRLSPGLRRDEGWWDTLHRRHAGNVRNALRELYDHAAAGRL
ncbi:MAG: hypothetical protein AAGG38_05085 [Planctomycetota bacterium]